MEKIVFQTADRVNKFSAYFFAAITQRVQALQAAGHDVIRLDIGTPDLPPAQFVIERMQQALAESGAHEYQQFKGIPALRAGWQHFYRQHFQVELHPDREVLPLIGSKEGVFHLTQVLVNPGDVVLVPDPGYQPYLRAAQFAGGEVYLMPLLRENGYLPDLAAIPHDIRHRAKLLWLNYPNNPTAAVAPWEFLTDAVAFARAHHILLCHDAPYMHVTYDGYQATSILEIPGASEVAVELNSLSKSHNMAGWRLGVLLGNAQVLDAVYRLKSNIDSGQFYPIMAAAAAALTGDQTWLTERNAIYQFRRDLVLQALADCGLQADCPKATLYVWCAVPTGWTDVAFTQALLEQAQISVAPGSSFGQYGAGYVRIAIGTATHRLETAMMRLRQWCAAANSSLSQASQDFLMEQA